MPADQSEGCASDRLPDPGLTYFFLALPEPGLLSRSAPGQRIGTVFVRLWLVYAESDVEQIRVLKGLAAALAAAIPDH
jgi:hypothetical protein